MDERSTAEQIIRVLDLRPLPGEGGYYAETHRGSLLPAAPGRPDERRSMATAIYYLITPDAFSALHRLPGDELFHFYLGDPVERLLLFPDGTSRIVAIGPNLLRGERPQALVPAGVWQGTRLQPSAITASPSSARRWRPASTSPTSRRETESTMPSPIPPSAI